ncbi:MAG: pseudouridine synthase [Bdellovibrionales bacterium]
MAQVKVFQFDIKEALEGKSLKEAVYLFLTETRFISISKREVKKLVDSGAVHRNSKSCFKNSMPMSLNDKVLVELPRFYLKAGDEDIKIELEISKNDVLFEDKNIILLNKPSGISTGPTLDPKRDHLYASVRRYLEKNSRSEVYVGMHHRLDLDTSGVVLFTKKKAANKGITLQFEGRTIKKSYLALAHRQEELREKNFTIKNHLARTKESKETKRVFVESVKSGGDYAETRFELLNDSELFLFFSVAPKTGRTHQIRVHLSEAGYPIVGDPFYPAKNPLKERLCLHAARLELVHPITKKELSISAPLPENWPRHLLEV